MLNNWKRQKKRGRDKNSIMGKVRVLRRHNTRELERARKDQFIWNCSPRKEDTMYIECFLLLKLSSLATMLAVHDYRDVNGSIVPPHTNRTSILHPAVMSKRETEESSDGSRIDFQLRNHRGPGTYIFGFDTGRGKSRQYRIEERLQNGSVKGRYGFYDPKGKLRIINYIAEPSNGYQERHHETITSKPET
ncbi:PREDICTED: uncharacterized protein LOC106740930 [Dinoponera quadriceps]|uniref:Uncharacterized protein LOC106740930 n=1 Tax=Dinoponera quadriceps TaxID=609295 RepID=A0A6P3WPV8_DINQU|nr:PREDICTED: uncharacterized protein LOC106740930 [Dinoponera quadriceps]